MTRLMSCLCRRDRALPWAAILIALAVANGWFGHARAATLAVAAAEAPPIQMDHISVAVSGSGSPVVLIPGLSSPRAVWDGVLPALERRHTVYRVQVNGFAGDDPRGNLTPGMLDGIVADLHRLIATRKLGAVPLVGHSMGGLVSLMLAERHPGDAGRVLVVDALPFIGVIFAPGSTPATLKPMAEGMRAQMAGLYGKPVPDAVARMIAQTNALKPASQEKVIGWTQATDMRVSAQAMYEDMMTDVRPQLASIAAPVTVLVPWTEARGGEKATLDLYRAQYAGTPKLTVQGVGDSGHFIMLDQPEAFAAALAAFLG